MYAAACGRVNEPHPRCVWSDGTDASMTAQAQTGAGGSRRPGLRDDDLAGRRGRHGRLPGTDLLLLRRVLPRAVQGRPGTIPRSERREAAPPALPTDVEYTCPMHPEVRQIGPGTCPKCGMALEPTVDTGVEESNPELDDMSRRFWISLALVAPIARGDDRGFHPGPAADACARPSNGRVGPDDPRHADRALGRSAVLRSAAGRRS